MNYDKCILQSHYKQPAVTLVAHLSERQINTMTAALYNDIRPEIATK